jgi:hypothetical protein
MSDDNRAELGRLIREELEDSGRGPVQVTRGWAVGNVRSFYGWKDGSTTPLRKSRGMLEDALGWRRGVVTEILEAPITATYSLSEVRDWSALGEQVLTKARDLPMEDLLNEASRRFWAMEQRIESLEDENAALRSKLGAGEGGNVVQLPARDSQDMFDVAANSTAPGRNMEHLEDEVEG